MSGKPTAHVTDPTTCPVPGHGSSPIAHGSSDVVFDGPPAAWQGGVSACGSSMISAVSSTVLINGLLAVTPGSIGARGNVVIGDSGTVLIGDVFASAPRTPALPLNRNNMSCPGRFQFIDHETDKPAAERRVRVWSNGGWGTFDTTDAGGMTS